MIRSNDRPGLAAAGAALALLAGLTVPTIAARAITPAARYDGLWSVSIITEKGDCDRGYRYPIRISHGVLGNGGAAGFTIAGRVTPSGLVKVTVSNGSQSATGLGRLAGNAGAGRWNGGSCSGTWTAERRSS